MATSPEPTSGRLLVLLEGDSDVAAVRAAGPRVVLQVLGATGLARAFETMTHQPQWRHRPFDEQVRRFAGAGSGRKALLARALTEALPPERLPAPLAGLLGSLPSS